MKSVAIQAVFLIAVIAIFLFFLVAIFAGWIDTTKLLGTEAGCAAKKLSYCSELYNKGRSFQWPSECGTAPNIKECCSVLRRPADDPKCQ